MSLERLVHAFSRWVHGHGPIISNPAVSINDGATGGGPVVTARRQVEKPLSIANLAVGAGIQKG
jgi:hypothetical protein